MTPNDHAMLEFAKKWAGFSGGDEYILPEFGITPTVFYDRILRMVTKSHLNEVELATRRQLRQLCWGKLGILDPRK